MALAPGRQGSYPLGHWSQLPTGEVPLKPTRVDTVGVLRATGAAEMSTVEPGGKAPTSSSVLPAPALTKLQWGPLPRVTGRTAKGGFGVERQSGVTGTGVSYTSSIISVIRFSGDLRQVT